MSADKPPAALLPGHRTRDTEGGEHRAPRSDEAGGKAWLTWRSYGRDHGLKAHEVKPDGTIIEMHDPQPVPRKKPKGVSSRQWGRS
jgi:hypothetical protein